MKWTFYFLSVSVMICMALIGLNGQDTENQLIVPSRVFDGQTVHEGWAVLVEKGKIKALGPLAQLVIPNPVKRINLPGTTLLPGLIEGHSHLLLHPYNETSWNDQVLVESEAERVVRATIHARKTIEAGFTTVRDLGSEGAGYADVGVKQAIEKGIIPGPRMLVAGPAIVATGSYGPKGFAPHVDVPQGADEADGHDNLIKVVREQMGKGADVVKVYADYRWGLRGEARATFSLEELQLMVKTAASSGRSVVAHAGTAEGMRRAILAGVVSIEHGDAGTPEVFKLMAEKGVALCPTLAAGDAILQYRGWRKGVDPDPERIVQKRQSFRQALDAGVIIVAGGDVGVFTHGDNARELEMMVDYGMKPVDVLKAATSVNARVFGLEGQLGAIRPGLLADLIVVDGKPDLNISDLRNIRLVMKEGTIVIEK
ncbi:metal-dependent hydrolase family protein [Haliscomenobacter hydrossis]|uniref:Amidohydrolase n=1 Tax=Haliscomenobacter hydrossis (strain ATCC 27775 / DSM 1100 / LMG 10767 / O) TaxID=760192 RepID=F4KRR5_HALH1|nr:amidohydrolase family protein [Haliscomenobacter hydrossis]AEE50019.1 amidohydrolase [Haliscomenobacter hydrossis DSM 1100]